MPPAIVSDWPLSRFNEFEAPSVRLAIVGLIPLMLTTELTVALVMTTSAVLEFGTPLSQFPGSFH